MLEHALAPRSGGAPGNAMSTRLSLLVDLASMLSREIDLDALLHVAGERLASALSADRATIWLIDAGRGELVARVAMLPELSELRQPMSRGVAGHVARTGEVVRLSDAARDPRFDPSADKATGYVSRSMLVAPIRDDVAGPVRGVVQVLNKHEGVFDEQDEAYLAALATQLGRALSLTTLRAENSRDPGVTLRGPFNRIVGTSPALREAYERVPLAAQTDATVLFRGATGTGKGLFARAVHVNSKRQAGPMVVVDCTTLPAQLVESELFGHERGAFTGADRRVLGKVESAQSGTLFIDEIGDLPPELQGKLLRLLQDRAFERVGGRQTLDADVRIVCATHRDLGALVAAGRFREDLYYRVKVVEITLPTLRERGPGEIEALARHFASMYSARHARPAATFTARAMQGLVDHGWPGNVRELEHFIESAIVLSPSGVIDVAPAHAARHAAVNQADHASLPLDLPLGEASRRYAERVVARHHGNKSLAAKSLGIGRNTLARLLGLPSLEEK